jgi:hypothetical protein
MFPSRLSAHLALKRIEKSIASTLHLQTVEQVVIRQTFVCAGRPQPTLETLNLCRAEQSYLIVKSLGDEITVVSQQDMKQLIETLSERDKFPAQRYLMTLAAS